MKYRILTVDADRDDALLALLRDAGYDPVETANGDAAAAAIIVDARPSEKALRQSEARFRAQYKSLPIPTYTWRKIGDDFVLSDFNDAARVATGGEAHRYIGSKATEFYERRAPLIKKHIERCFNERAAVHDEITYTFQSTGETKNLEVDFVFVPPDAVTIHARDITVPRLAEKENRSLSSEIETQRQRLNQFIADIPGVVWEARIRDGERRAPFDFVSDYVEQMVGYTAEEWLKEPDFWLRIIHPEDRARAEFEIKSFVETGGKTVQQCRWIAKNGAVIWVETQMILVADETGAPASLRGISIDVSERKNIEEALQKSEEQLRQSQKLESVGRLAGGIAHDFNNMLTAINGYSDLILRELGGEDESLRKKVLEIKKAGERSAALTHQLLAFSRRQVLQPKLFDLNRTVGEMNQMLHRLIGEDIELSFTLSPEPCLIEADPGQLSQVILNLVVNARDAMPAGGKLIVETATIQFEDEPVARFSPRTRGKYARLCVEDNGVGIERKILENIFEPFFTTKQAGVGTGLGLSTVYGIVKQSGGFVWVDSEPGEGTEFKVYLPLAEAKANRQAKQKIVEQFPHGTETILLVEDEEMVRDLTRRILEVCGYTVIEAQNGAEAWEICEANDFQIDLLMTDVVMPQMDGRELSEKVTAANPRVRTLFASGYMNDRVMRLGVSADAVNFIQKPFAPDALARKVREMLDLKE